MLLSRLFGDGLRSPRSCDDVFALCVFEEFAVEAVFAGGGVSGEGDACHAIAAHVSECHGLDGDGGSPVFGDIVEFAVCFGARGQPALEDGGDGLFQLFQGILREGSFGVFLDDVFVLLDEFEEVLFFEVGIEVDVVLSFEVVERGFELVVRNLEDDVSEHVDESSVGIECESAVVAFLSESFERAVVEPEVEDGIHHAGHGDSCA